MKLTFTTSQELAEFLSENPDRKFKIKTKFSHKEGETGFEYYQVTGPDEEFMKTYTVIYFEGSGYQVSIGPDLVESDSDLLNVVRHDGPPCFGHYVRVNSSSMDDAKYKGRELISDHLRDPMHPGTLDPKVLLKSLKSLYKSPWGFGEKLHKIKSLSDIKVTDFFLTDKTLSIKLIADITE